METRIAQCPFCGELYNIFTSFVGDQSACPSCKQKAANNSIKYSPYSNSGKKYIPAGD